MRILIADNNIDPDCWGAKEFRTYALKVTGATVTVRRGPQNDLPRSPHDFDRLIITGSKTSALAKAPWIANLDELIRRATEAKKPILGVCYGHQAIARALGGDEFVRKSAAPEVGWCKIEIVEPSPIFKNLPHSFYSFGSHFEEVSRVPKGLKSLASSPQCAIQALEVVGYPVFGIQFHPEKNLDDAYRTFKERKKVGTPKILLEAEKSESLYNSQIGEMIFKNFFAL